MVLASLLNKLKQAYNFLIPFFFGLSGVLAFAPFSIKFLIIPTYSYLIHLVFFSDYEQFKTKLILWTLGHWGIGVSWIIVSVYYYGNIGYAASSIVFLSKKKDKDGTEVVGNIVHCKNHKSRLTIENKMVDVRLSYETGLDRYYGLLELAIKYDIFKQVSTRIELPDGTTQFSKTINNNPDKYFTEEVMQQIDEAAKKEFMYGQPDTSV